MIGVLAVLAILATILISTTTRSLDVAAASLERTNLVNYATALQKNILRNRYIPGTDTWYTNIASELDVNVWSVTNNSRNIPRYFVVDPTIQIAGGVLPYDQDKMFPAGASGRINQPVSPRVMIVTSLSLSPSRQFPSFITGGTQPTSTQFNNLWNWTDQSANAPSDWSTSWNGYGTDLMVQRVNLTPLFVHLTLQNYPPPPLSGSPGQYTFNGGAVNVVYDTPNNVDAYILKNSVLTLRKDAGSGGGIQVDQVLSRDASFFYIQQVWRGTVAYGTNINQSTLPVAVGSAFLATAQAFVTSPNNTSAQYAVTPPMLVNTMSNFMAAYIAYANAGFPTAPLNPNYRAAKDAQTTNFLYMTYLANGLPH
jgi:hypothetical protein